MSDHAGHQVASRQHQSITIGLCWPAICRQLPIKLEEGHTFQSLCSETETQLMLGVLQSPHPKVLGREMPNSDSFAHSDLVAGFILNDYVQIQHQRTPGTEGQEKIFCLFYIVLTTGRNGSNQFSASKPIFIKSKLHCSRLKLEFKPGTF